MRVAFRVCAVVAAVLLSGFAIRQSLHGSPAPDASVTPCQVAGCRCGCAEGGPCNCAERAANQEVLDALAAINARLDALESPQAVVVPPEPIAVLPERTADDIMQGLENVFQESQEHDPPTVVSRYTPTPATIEPDAIEPDAQPTPYEVIFKAIDLLELENTETLVDFGCGPDARVLTHAFHDTGCRGIGIELDPDRAASARELVHAAGLSPWIEIVEGDVVTTPVEGNVGFVYLWPETLEELRPKLQELDRFISYAHQVPGLDMQRIDVPGYEPLWYWERAPEVSYAERPYAVYNGRRYYSDYNPGCNCSMCRTIREQLASREHVEQVPTQAPPAQSAPQTTTIGTSTPTYSISTSQRSSYCSSCANGQCGRPMRFRGRR